jgi:plasmid replication initiation protein
MGNQLQLYDDKRTVVKANELLKMREGISVLRMSVEELREILGLENSYQYFSELKHHVIKKAQEEIREKTDIYFTYDI